VPFYDAFVSYSHAGDGRLAPRLQAGLQRFAKPWWRRRALRVFRDETGLSANPHLWSSIEEALSSSEWFVFLASPEAARSEWVGRELSWWLTNRDPGRILPVVTGGELVWDPVSDRLDRVASDAVPGVLADVWVNEPRWVDLRWARDVADVDLRDTRFRDAVADVAAPLHGVAKDELNSEEVRQHRRTVRTVVGAATALGVFAVAAVVAGVVAMSQRDQAREQRMEAETQRAEAETQRAEAETQRAEAETQRAEAETQARVSQARAVAAQATANAPVSVDRALVLGAHAVGLNDEPETRRGLIAALDAAGPLVGFRRDIGELTSLAISDDGSTVATLTVDGVLATWDAETWEPRRKNDTAALDLALGIEWASDGRHLVAYASNGAQLYRADTLEPASPMLGSDPSTVAISWDGYRYASVDSEGTSVVMRDVISDEEIARAAIPVDCVIVTWLTLSPSDQAALDCATGRTFLVELAADSAARFVEVAIGYITAFSLFSPDGSLLLMFGYSGQMTLVDAASGARVGDTRMLAERTYSFAFDPTGEVMLTGGDNGTVSLWRLPSLRGPGSVIELIDVRSGLGEGVIGVGFLSGSDRFIAGTSSGVSSWDLSRRTALAETIRTASGPVLLDDGKGGVATAWSGTSSPASEVQVVSAVDGSTLRSLDVTDGQPIVGFEHGDGGTRILVATGGLDQFRLMVVSASDGAIELELLPGDPAQWNPESWSAGSPWITWSPDGRWVTFRVASGGVGIGDLKNDAVIELQLDEPPYAGNWSPAGEFVVGGLFGTLMFVDPATGRVNASLPLTPGFSIADVETTADGLLVVTSEKGEVWLIDPDDRQAVGEPFRWGGTQLQQASVSPDGGTVAALSRDGTIRLWDRTTQRPLADPLEAHASRSRVDDVLYLPDGTFITISESRSEAGEAIMEFLRWSFESPRLVATACELAGRELTEEEWRSFVDPDGSAQAVCT
jgi:WD40 repeat protein